MRIRELPPELRTTRKIGREEEITQTNLVAHLRWRAMPGVIWFAVPNGGPRSKASAGKLKAMGVRRGVHDLVFLMPGPGVFTLELKYADNKMTPEQEQFARDIEAIGGEWACAWTLDDALKILEAIGAIRPEAE